MPLAPGHPKKKSTTASADVINRSGAFAGGPAGSGSATHKPKPKVPKNARQQIVSKVEAKKSGTFLGGVAGSGVVKDQWVGKGADKRYVQVPDPIKGSGGPVPPSYNQTKRNAAAAGVDAGASRNAPGKPRRAAKTDDVPIGDADGGRPAPSGGAGPATGAKSGGSGGSSSGAKSGNSGGSSSGAKSGGSSAASKPSKSAPALPGTLNYFMKMTMKDGRKNQRNRAYQMFKNYKKTGKLPTDIGSATQ